MKRTGPWPETPPRQRPIAGLSQDKHAAEVAALTPLIEASTGRPVLTAGKAQEVGRGSALLVWERCHCDVERDEWHRNIKNRNSSQAAPVCNHDPLRWGQETATNDQHQDDHQP